MLKIKNLSFSYGSKKIFENLSLTIDEGERVALIGPSGCGKTTLLRLITGLEKPHLGEMFINGLPANSRKTPVSYMMQRPHLLPWKNVLDNLILSAELLFPFSDRRLNTKRALELLSEVGLESNCLSFPHELSEGMQQRAALARALLPDTPLLILDEPFSALDPLNKNHMLQLIKEIHVKKKKTLLSITHDLDEARTFSNKILLIQKNCIISFSSQVSKEELLQAFML